MKAAVSSLGSETKALAQALNMPCSVESVPKQHSEGLLFQGVLVAKKYSQVPAWRRAPSQDSGLMGQQPGRLLLGDSHRTSWSQ